MSSTEIVSLRVGVGDHRDPKIGYQILHPGEGQYAVPDLAATEGHTRFFLVNYNLLTIPNL